MSRLLKNILSLRLAIRQEEAERLASSGIKRLKDEEGFWTYRKESGKINQENHVTILENGIAMISVDGALSYRSDEWTAWFGEDTYDSIGQAFDRCMADEEINGIIFDINSPGGECNGVADLSDKIFAARESGKKPFGIVARTGGQMCSAAYWLGSACDKVYTASNGTLGSIGTLIAFNKAASDSMNVVVSDLSPFKSPSPNDAKGLKLIKKELNSLTEVFISAVARNRGTTVENVKENFGKGSVFIGAEAVEAGLADGVCSIEEICELMNNLKIKGANMPETKTAAAEPVDVEAIKAEAGANAVAAYKERCEAIHNIFAGLNISQETEKEYIDGDKTVAEATAFALEQSKKTVTAQAEELAKITAERDSFKTKAEEGEAKVKALEESSENGLTEEQKRLIKAGIEHEAHAQNSVAGCADSDGATAEQKRVNSVKRAADNYYRNRR